MLESRDAFNNVVVQEPHATNLMRLDVSCYLRGKIDVGLSFGMPYINYNTSKLVWLVKLIVCVHARVGRILIRLIGRFVCLTFGYYDAVVIGRRVTLFFI